MKLLKALIISFSMYSGIPMPQFEWKEEDMKYMLCFFPWIGAVIGLGIVLWSMLCKQVELGMLCYTMGGAAIPLLITGGFHVDGFMDTMDAFHSYQPKEKKLEILKDSHIGAFFGDYAGTLRPDLSGCIFRDRAGKRTLDCLCRICVVESIKRHCSGYLPLREK